MTRASLIRAGLALLLVVGLLAGGAAGVRAVWGWRDRLQFRADSAAAAAKAAETRAQIAAAEIARLQIAIGTADSVSRETQTANARLVARFGASRAALQAELDSLKAAGATVPPLLAPVLARCDSLAAAVVDTLPCARRVAARDSVLRAADSARAALAAANDALHAQVGALNRLAHPRFLGFLPPLRCVAGGGPGVTFGGHPVAVAGVFCGPSLGH